MTHRKAMNTDDEHARHGAPDLSMLADPLTFMKLPGAALAEVFTFLAEPSNVLNTSAACRSWRSLANDEDVWRTKAEAEFGAGSANTGLEHGPQLPTGLPTCVD